MQEFDFIPYTDNNTQEPKARGAFVPLTYIVRNVQNRFQDYDERQFKRYLQLAIDGVRDLRIYHQAAIEVIYAKLNETGILRVPSDYIAYTKIGIPINGQLYILTLNDNMLLNRAVKCGTDIRQLYAGTSLPVLGDGYYFAPHYFNGQYIDGLYGLGGGFNTAYYKEDKTAGLIMFDGVIQNNVVVMEYKSSGIRAGSVINAIAIEPLVRWVAWQACEYDDRVSAATKQRREEQFDKAVEKMRVAQNKFTLQEYLDVCYSKRKQTPKF